MPIVSCELDGRPGFRWGGSGKCYTYSEGDRESMRIARARASAQGQAAYSAGYREAVKLPNYVVSALKKGLELHKDGFSGDGLVAATVRSATTGVNSGEWPEDKIIRAAAWLARHADDRKLVSGKDWSDPPTPGYTAWLLWGDSGDGRGRKWIQTMADKIKSKKEDNALNDTKDAVVTVVRRGEGNVYRLDGVIKEPLTIDFGTMVVMDVSHASNEGHPMAFSLTANGTHAGGKEITEGVERNGVAGEPGSFIKFTPSSSSQYFYFCKLHSGMGSSIDVLDEVSEAPGDKAQSTPAPPEDRIKGGRNTGRGKANAPSPKFNDRTNVALKRLVKGHNDSFGDDPRKKVTLPMLRKVYLRGAGAYSTSHRPGVSRAAWSFGRVRAFLKMLKNLKPDDPKYNGPDNDLLPAAHPLSSKKKRKEQMNAEEGMYYKYEGYGKLYEGNFGMKFVALRHALGEMLHYYMAKEIRDDDVAAKYVEDMGKMIDAAKAMPEHGEAAKSSFYTLMSMVSDVLGNWMERDPNTAGGMMYHSLRMIQDRFEGKPARDPRDHREPAEGGDYPYESKASTLDKLVTEASGAARSVLKYIAEDSRDASLRAKLERKCDSILLAADNTDRSNEEPVLALRSALNRLRR